MPFCFYYYCQFLFKQPIFGRPLELKLGLQRSVQGIIYTPLLGVVHPPIDVKTHPKLCSPPLGVCVLF